MANDKYSGNAITLAQVTAWVFAGTWGTSDVVTVTINGKAVATVTGSATIATFLDTVVTALNASTITEFTEITWSRSSSTLIGTADTAGFPFTVTLSKTSTSGTIDGGSGGTGTNSTANSSPNDISVTTNWSTGSLPANGDTPIFEGTSNDILYGLDQSAITGVFIKVESSFSGKIGLPYRNASNYAEYRSKYLQYGISTLVYAGTGQRAKFDCGSTSATVTVNNTGSSAESGLETFLLKGSAIAALNVNKGSVAVSPFDDETSTVTTANIAYITNQASDSKVRFGPGCSITTVNMFGGQVETNHAFTTLNLYAGTLTHKVGNITTVVNEGGTLIVNAAVTITTYTGTAGSVLDLSRSTGAVTLTNSNFYAGSKVKDPFRRLVFTNPYALKFCGLKDVDFDLGENLTIAPTAV